MWEDKPDFCPDFYYENKPPKNHRLTMRLTDDEYEKLSNIMCYAFYVKNEKGQVVGFHRMTQIVQCLIDNLPYEVSTSAFANDYRQKQAEKKLDIQTKTELLASRKYYTYQMRRIGITLNQLNKKMNANADAVSQQELEEIKSVIESIKQEIKAKGVFDDD